MNLTAQNGMDNSDKLMNPCYQSGFLCLSSQNFLFKVAPEELIIPHQRSDRKKKSSSQVTIPSFRDLSLSFKFSRLMNGWVNPSIGNKFLVRAKSLYLPYLCDKMRNSFPLASFYGHEDLEGGRDFLLAFSDKESLYSVKLSVQADEASNFTLRYLVVGWVIYTDGVFRDTYNLMDRKECLSSSIFRDELRNSPWLCVRELVSRGKREELREGYMYEPFNLHLNPCNFLGDSLSFPCQDLDLSFRFSIHGNGTSVEPEEICDGRGILFVCFCFCGRELGEFVYEDGTEDNRVEMIGYDEGEGGCIVGTGELHPDYKLREVGAFRGEHFKECCEAIRGHREEGGKENISFLMDQGRREEIFGRIVTTGETKHIYNSVYLIYEASASISILHSDEGSKTLEEWNSPALSLLSYQVYKSIDNINFS